MQSQIPGNESVSEETIGGMAANIQFVVGVDEENCVHCHSPAAGEIRVYQVGEGYEVGDYLDSEDKVRVESLEGRPLSHWMEFVQVRRGWKLTTHRAPEGF